MYSLILFTYVIWQSTSAQPMPPPTTVGTFTTHSECEKAMKDAEQSYDNANSIHNGANELRIAFICVQKK